METEQKKRRQKRDDQVRKHFEDLERKNPKWKLQSLLEETANRFPPLSTTTVSLIINKGSIYK